VRPCCTFGGSLGNLKDATLAEVLRSAPWDEVKAQIAAGETPQGCVNCYEREKATGWSVRTAQFDVAATGDDRWRKGLTQIEINSSNICNLACTHCSSNFSSKWLETDAKFGSDVAYHHLGADRRIHGADPESIVRQLAALDLSYLEIVRFKGGEPMLNLDVPAVLQHLLDRDILPRVSVDFVSNGSIVNERVLSLLEQAGHVTMCVSVDGIGPLQAYIRRGPSENERIEEFLHRWSALERVQFTINVSVMAYNVFSLDRVSEWWNGLASRYPGKFAPLVFGLHVVDPAYLSVSVLTDATRRSLVRKYSRLPDADYSSVIQSLQQPYAGAELHDKFVTYTRDMDNAWQADVLAAVPDLKPELTLTARREQRLTWRSWFERLPSSPSDALAEGIRLSRAGRHRRAVRMYDRFLKQSRAGISATWEIRLHRAIVLGQSRRWVEALSALERLVGLDPAATLQTLERCGDAGAVLDVISPRLAGEEGFVRSPSFRVLLEGLSHRALKHTPEAAARFNHALSLDPEFVLARVARQQMAEQ
jgi:pyruvate-formate lyase-activating enzyme